MFGGTPGLPPTLTRTASLLAYLARLTGQIRSGFQYVTASETPRDSASPCFLRLALLTLDIMPLDKTAADSGIDRASRFGVCLCS